MKALYFDITIKASVSEVYQKMLGKGTFEQWTSEFSPTSRYQGNWEKGSKMLFLADEADGKECGMVSRVNENTANTFVSIEHLGLYEEGQEIMKGEKVNSFSGALEEYTFEQIDTGTLLKIRMDVIQEWEEYFMESWPRALKKLKHIIEA